MQSPCQKAEIVEVIKVLTTIGNGEDQPYKEVVQYWTKEGKFLTESTH